MHSWKTKRRERSDGKKKKEEKEKEKKQTNKQTKKKQKKQQEKESKKRAVGTIFIFFFSFPDIFFFELRPFPISSIIITIKKMEIITE